MNLDARTRPNLPLFSSKKCSKGTEAGVSSPDPISSCDQTMKSQNILGKKHVNPNKKMKKKTNLKKFLIHSTWTELKILSPETPCGSDEIHLESAHHDGAMPLAQVAVGQPAGGRGHQVKISHHPRKSWKYVKNMSGNNMWVFPKIGDFPATHPLKS